LNPFSSLLLFRAESSISLLPFYSSLQLLREGKEQGREEEGGRTKTENQRRINKRGDRLLPSSPERKYDLRLCVGGQERNACMHAGEWKKACPSSSLFLFPPFLPDRPPYRMGGWVSLYDGFFLSLPGCLKCQVAV